jgi:hypothetical protein
MTREIDEIARGAQHALAALRDFRADRREGDVARTPLHQVHAELPLKLADLHRQCRLRHRAGLRGASEVPVLRHGGEIAELPERDHR